MKYLEEVVMREEIAIFGGSLINKIHKNCKFRVTDKCLWIHPGTLCNVQDIEEISSLRKLEVFLEKCKSDFLVIELSTLRMTLYETDDGSIYRYEDIKKYEKEKHTNIHGKRLSVIEMDANLIEKNLLVLCEKIKKKFDKTQVILVSAVPSKVVDNGGYYVLGSDYWQRMCKIFRKCEKIVYESLLCNYLDITQYYVAKFHSDSYQFASFFYEEIEKQIRVMERQSGFYNNQVNDKHRYYTAAPGFLSLYRKSVFEILLEQENLVDYCITYTNTKFINTYIEDIIELRHKERYKTLDDLREVLEEKTKFNERMQFIIKILQNVDIDEAEEKLLEEKMMINDLLAQQLAEQLLVYGDFNPKIITNRNIRYYLMVKRILKKGQIKVDDINRLLLMQDVKKPMLIDIWGSCVSRFIFNYADEGNDRGRYVVNRYVFHANPLNINKNKTEYIHVEGLQDETYDERCLKIQLDGEIRTYYENSESEWIIIDLYALFSKSVFKVGDTYICIFSHIGEKYFPQKKCCPIYKEMMYDDIVREMKEFVSFLKNKYQGRIILISAHNSIYYSQDGVIRFFENREYIEDINFFLDKIENQFVELTDCYYVDISRYFISDDKQMSCIGPFHYEKVLYLEEYKVIKQIFEGCYNITDKHINKVNNSLLLERFINYKDRNRNVILDMFPYHENPIWQYLVYMDISWLKKNFLAIDQLVVLCSLCKNVEDIQSLCLSEQTRSVLKELLKNFGRT